MVGANRGRRLEHRRREHPVRQPGGEILVALCVEDLQDGTPPTPAHPSSNPRHWLRVCGAQLGPWKGTGVREEGTGRLPESERVSAVDPEAQSNVRDRRNPNRENPHGEETNGENADTAKEPDRDKPSGKEPNREGRAGREDSGTDGAGAKVRTTANPVSGKIRARPGCTTEPKSHYHARLIGLSSIGRAGTHRQPCQRSRRPPAETSKCESTRGRSTHVGHLACGATSMQA